VTTANPAGAKSGAGVAISPKSGRAGNLVGVFGADAAEVFLATEQGAQVRGIRLVVHVVARSAVRS
jgi:hypothetical protein